MWRVVISLCGASHVMNEHLYPALSPSLRAMRFMLAGGLLVLLTILACGCAADSSRIDAALAASNGLKDLPVESLIYKGNDYLETDNPQLARLHFSIALQKDPNSVPARVGLGQALYRLGDAKGAAEAFTKVLTGAPQSPDALLGLARIQRDQGDHAAAAEYLSQALGSRLDDPELLTELAITYDGMGQETRAEPLWRRVTELRPNQAASYNNLGFNYLLQGRYDEAISALERALSLEADNRRTRNNLGTAYALKGDEEASLRYFESAVGKAAAYNNLGYLYMTQGEWQRAEQSFKKALDLNPVFYQRAQENLDRLNRIRTKSAPSP